MLFNSFSFASFSILLEIVGDGTEREWLQAQFRSDSRVEFHGQLTGPEYWRVIRNWDTIVFTSDFEGLPMPCLKH